MRILSVIASVSLLSLLLTACDSPREREAKQKQARDAVKAERDANLAQVTAEFTKAHNGDDRWPAELRDKPMTTLALQQRLIRQKGQVIVAGVSVVDVAKEGDHYRLDLLVPNNLRGWRYSDSQRLKFEIRCALVDVKFDELQSNPITREFQADYLVAAQINEVKSAQQVVRRAHSETEYDEPSTVFTAKGECLGLKDIDTIRRSYNKKSGPNSSVDTSRAGDFK